MVTLQVPARQLALVDEHGRHIAQPGVLQVAVGGRQPDAQGAHASAADGLSATVNITGSAVEVR